MSLTFTKAEDDQRQLMVTVDIAEEYMQRKMRETARQLASRMNLPGFRRGRIPYQVMVRRFGEDTIRAETVEELTQPVFEQMMAELEEPPYAQVQLKDIELNPARMIFVIPLAPQVTLGDYRDIRKDVEPVEVTEEAMEQALKLVQQRHQVLEPVERAAEVGDMVTLGGTGILTEPDESGEEVVIFDQDRVDLLLDAEQLVFGADFVDALVGVSANESKEFTIALPDDFQEEEYAEKEANFTLTVHEVKRRELPEIDDDLAREEGDYDTLEELREQLYQDLHDHAVSHAKSDRLEAWIDSLMSDAEFTYPPVLVDQELDDMVESLQEQTSRYGWEWEDYLAMQEQTEEGLREEWYEQAVRRVERSLRLSQFMREEKLRVSDDEIESKISERYANIDNEEVRQYMVEHLMKGEGASSVVNELLLDKTDERIVAIYQGEAPDLDELAAEEEE